MRYLLSTLIVSSLFFASCKNKNTSTGNADSTSNAVDTVTTTTPAPTPATVVVAEDDELTKGVKDATKDFPGVTATVNDGEITLTGNIMRDKLADLMQSLNTLHPKKINNNLTIN